MNENIPNPSPEPIDSNDVDLGNPVNVRRALTKRRIVLASAAAGVAGLVAGINGLSGAEGVPCDPVMDNGCVPDPTTSSLPEFTKPSVVETSTTTSTTEPEEESTTTTSTTEPEEESTTTTSTTEPEEESTTTTQVTTPPTHVSTPPGMPPITIAVPGSTTPPAPEAHVTE